MQKMLQRLIGDDVALETELSPALPPVLVDERVSGSRSS